MGRISMRASGAVLAFVLAAGLATPAAAQSGTGTRGISIYGGFSYEHTSHFLLDTVNTTSTLGGTPTTEVTGAPRSHDMFGGELTLAVPLNAWLSIDASGSYHRSTSSNNILPGGAYTESNRITILVIPGEGGIKFRQTSLTAVGGLELRRPYSNGRLSPFLRAQAGIARATTAVVGLDRERANIDGGSRFSVTSFAANIGAGLDLQIGRNVDLRLIEVDYRYVASANRHMVSNGASVDTTITNLSAPGSVVTTLQSVDAHVAARNDLVVGAGIVVHFGH